LYKLLRVSSIGSLCGVAAALIVASLTAPRTSLFGLAIVAVIILARHTSNIRRLLQQKES
jgi:glycerol-3-phosphate acyltransferase PlsY